MRLCSLVLLAATLFAGCGAKEPVKSTFVNEVDGYSGPTPETFKDTSGEKPSPSDASSVILFGLFGAAFVATINSARRRRARMAEAVTTSL